MSQQDDFLGGLHFDGHRDVQVGPQTGIVRYYPVDPSAEPPRDRRVSPWWHALGVLVGAVGIVVAAFAWGYGKFQLARGWVVSLDAWRQMRLLLLTAKRAVRKHLLEIKSSRRRLSLQSR